VAHKDAASLAKLFKKGAREKLVHDPKGAAQDAGASAELATFLDGLSSDQRQVLVATWDHMSKRGVTADVDGETVSFL
jgi:hypothetical protein